MHRTDALIIGGGPAGLAAAIALRQRGLTCVVVEPLAPAIDKGCGEGLMPDALEALRALGIVLAPTDGQPCSGISFLNSTYRVEAQFRGTPALGMRRTQLHRRLVHRAEEAGAMLRWGSHATLAKDGAERGFAMVDGERVEYRWLIGADGEASSVRRWAALDQAGHLSRRYALRRHYQVQPWNDCVEVHWGAGAQVYVTPVAPDCISLVFISRDQARVRTESARAHWLDAFPTLTARLRGAVSLDQRGAVTATRRLKRVATHSVALVGDASGSADAITGEGLAMAFRQALALADSLAAGSTEAYARSHRSIAQLPQRMAALMLLMDRYPAVEQRAMGAFAHAPALFEELLAVHSGSISISRFLLQHGISFAWRFLAQGPMEQALPELKAS